MAGHGDEMFMTRSLNVTTKTTEQHLIAGSDKSVAYVTNYSRLRLTFRTTKPNSDRHEASRGLFATTELLVYHWLPNVALALISFQCLAGFCKDCDF